MSDEPAGAARSERDAPAVVVDARDEGRYRALQLARPDPAANRATVRAHRAPGQFVRVGADAVTEKTYFALAAPPDPEAEGLELLIRSGGELADHLVTLQPGDRVRMSEPAGAGYALDRCRDRDLLLLAAGSGVAPVRAAAHVVARDRRAYGRVTFYYGQAHESEFAYRGDLDALAARDIRLVLVVSGDQPDWRGHRGWVQRVADAESESWNPERTCIVMCGMPEMEAEVRDIARRRGIPPERVLTNV